VASDLCTRFATQIVLRRAPAEEGEARITIIPGPTSRLDETLNQRLLGFERRLEAVDFGCREFEDIFDEVRIVLGQDRNFADLLIGSYLYGGTRPEDDEPGGCGKKVFR
jgi:hypothetical protein